MDSSLFFGIATLAYILAMVAYIAYLSFRNSTVGLLATTVTGLGFLCHTVAFGMRWHEFFKIGGMGWLRAIPLTNLYESLVFFVWCLIAGYLIIEWRYKNRSFGAFITPIAGMALAFIDMTGMSKDIHPLVPALQSNWLLAHVTMSFIAYATFAISAATAIMYLAETVNDRKNGTYIFWTVTLGMFITTLVAMGVARWCSRWLRGLPKPVDVPSRGEDGRCVRSGAVRSDPALHGTLHGRDRCGSPPWLGRVGVHRVGGAVRRSAGHRAGYHRGLPGHRCHRFRWSGRGVGRYRRGLGGNRSRSGCRHSCRARLQLPVGENRPGGDLVEERRR